MYRYSAYGSHLDVADLGEECRAQHGDITKYARLDQYLTIGESVLQGAG